MRKKSPWMDGRTMGAWLAGMGASSKRRLAMGYTSGQLCPEWATKTKTTSGTSFAHAGASVRLTQYFLQPHLPAAIHLHGSTGHHAQSPNGESS
ncbi:hypothetical protein VTJ04DRAFT_5036 [Mycothermus thermophilus]|uniref:uncharacterized protein n=1 Tax=Humicola insolens TaxID=85995 RepID=UPI0037442811